MENIVEIKELNFGYNENKLYDNFALTIKPGKFITLMGPANVGKTTLANIIYGNIDAKSYIKVDGEFLNKKNIMNIRRKIGYVMQNNDNIFILDNVKDNMIFNLKKYGYTEEESETRINEICNKLNIKSLLKKDNKELSGGEQQLIVLAIALAHDPLLLILDETMIRLDGVKRDNIFKLLRSKVKNGMSVLNITNNSEDILEGTDLIIFNNKKIMLCTTVNKAFNDVDVFKANELELPFIIELSNKLQYYKVIDKNYLDIKKMVNDLWK